MTFESNQLERSDSACYIRTECKNESDSKYFKQLFENQWDYFVIKHDDESGKLRSFIECCGRLKGIG